MPTTELTKEQFIKQINDLRRQNKNQWYVFSDVVEGKSVKLKGFGTWLQIFTVDGINYSGLMDLKVSEFLELLRKPF